MNVPYLVDDCLYHLAQHITDIDTLYNCLYVNHFMCKSVIPKLWSRALFKAKRKDLLIRTYLSCLNEEEKASLIPFNINLSDVNQHPFLQYEKYMESCNNVVLEGAVHDWLKLTSTHRVDRKDLRIKQISRALWIMFLSRCHNFKSFFYDISEWSDVEFDFPEGSMTLNVKPSLSNLQVLTLCTNGGLNGSREIEGPLNFLKSIPSVCSNIQELGIYDVDSGVDNGLFSDIIKSQRSIKSLSYMGSTHSVIPSLKVHKNSLTQLVFFSSTIGSLEALTYLECLESLDICDCIFTVNGDHILSSIFRNLKELSLMKNNLKPDTVAEIIKKTGHTLKRLILDVITLETMVAASQYIQDIVHLGVSVNFEIPPIFFFWIKKLKLERLIFFESSISYSNTFMRDLRMNLPPTITELSMDFFNPTATELSNFMDSCEAPLRSLVLRFNSKHIDLYLKVLAVIVPMMKTLKTLSFTNSPRNIIWRDAQKQYIDTIKESGVEILTKRYEIYIRDVW
ncbi:15628_t:CDS:1 [Acaulospora morrowiae]|uniref:15628_t:CDS:1 n=1 Tax=Acaulospora morrowiae TaxID=94023 RepID=A0A9N9FPW1_9GLOM|nr:15628_t:CDS:1 [Acaulospora morrowiae]